MSACLGFSLLQNAPEELAALQQAVKEVVTIVNPIYSKEHDEIFVGFEGSFGSKHVTPRTLTSRYLGNLVCVEGIVTKCKAGFSYKGNVTQCKAGFIAIKEMSPSIRRA